MKLILPFILFTLILSSCTTQLDFPPFEKRLKENEVARYSENSYDLRIKEINEEKSFKPEDYVFLSQIYFSRKDYNMSLMNINRAIFLTEGTLDILKVIDNFPPWRITDIMAEVMVSVYGIMLNKPVDSDMVDTVGEKINEYLSNKNWEYISVVDARWNLKDSLPELYYQRALVYVCLKKYRKAEKDLLFCYRNVGGHSEYQKALWEFRRAYLNESNFRKDDLLIAALQEAEEFKENRTRERRIDALYRFFPRCYQTPPFMSDYNKPYFTMTEKDVIDLLGPPDYVRYHYFEETGIYKDEVQFVYELNDRRRSFVVTFFKDKVVSAY